MPLTISTNKIFHDEKQLFHLAQYAFTLAVDEACFYWPCDVVVRMKKIGLREIDALRRLAKPIVTVEQKDIKGLDFIKLPELRKYPDGEMVALALADRLASAGSRLSYAVGLHTSRINTPFYNDMGLTHTVNLDIHSHESVWPKLSKLPHLRKVIVNITYRSIAVSWLRINAAKKLSETCDLSVNYD